MTMQQTQQEYMPAEETPRRKDEAATQEKKEPKKQDASKPSATCTKRITSIGGQALMEGILMRGPKKTTVAIRLPSGEIEKQEMEKSYLRDKSIIWRIPLLRGIGGLIDSLSVGFKALSLSAEKAEMDEEEEEPSKFDLWLEKHFGDKVTQAIMWVAGFLGVVLAIALFFFLPTLLWNGVTFLAGEGAAPALAAWRSLAEGVMRILIFVLYIFFCSKVPYMHRVFQYHGAEHKSIFCYENGEELTVENVRKYRRFHPRCGTSFMIIMLLLGIIIGFFIPFSNPFLRTAVKLLCIPAVVAIGYEIIRICGRYENWVTRIISAPGMWMQHITTQEPDDSMIEVAIAALKDVIPENGEDLIRR